MAKYSEGDKVLVVRIEYPPMSGPEIDYEEMTFVCQENHKARLRKSNGKTVLKDYKDIEKKR